MLIQPLKFANYISGNTYRISAFNHSLNERLLDPIISYETSCETSLLTRTLQEIYVNSVEQIKPFVLSEYVNQLGVLLRCYKTGYGMIASFVFKTSNNTYEIRLAHLNTVFTVPFSKLFDGKSISYNCDRIQKAINRDYFSPSSVLSSITIYVEPTETILQLGEGKPIVTFKHFEHDVNNIITVGEGVNGLTQSQIDTVNIIIQSLYNVVKCMFIPSNNTYELIMI